MESSLTKRVFDESAGLYDHVWKLRAREMSQSFAATIRDRMAPYARQKWYERRSCARIRGTGLIEGLKMVLQRYSVPTCARSAARNTLQRAHFKRPTG